MIKAASAGTAIEVASTSGNGVPSFNVSRADVYAPRPMKAAWPSDSWPIASTTYMLSASRPLMPSA